MRVTFVGVGEAFDERLPNTSLFLAGVCGEGRRTVLLDCGFTAAAAFFACQAIPGPDREQGPDAVWISHFHGDHFFGLPYLLARLHEVGRERPLLLAGDEAVEDRVKSAVSLAYPNLLEKLAYPLHFASVGPGEAFSICGFPARATQTGHGAPCLALRLETHLGALYYSGDGAPTEACRELANGCALIVQEAYGVEAGPPGHGPVAEAIGLGETAARDGALAPVHIRRDVRRARGEAIQARLSAAGVRAFLPEPGAMFMAENGGWRIRNQREALPMEESPTTR